MLINYFIFTYNSSAKKHRVFMPSIFQHAASIPFGLYPLKYEKEIDKVMTCLTFANIVSWIPVIGAAATIEHIRISTMGKSTNAEDRAVRKALFIRCLTEIFCLGPILMIVDIITTIARACLPKPRLSQ